MWDIGGQDSLRQAWSTYYSGSHFLILVVDSTDRERLAVSKEELYKMLGHEVGVHVSITHCGIEPCRSCNCMYFFWLQKFKMSSLSW